MHVTHARVRYAETDQASVAYHARYLNWFEVGRTEMLRDLGHPYAALERERDILLTVVEAVLRYHRPAAYDDLLRIESDVAEVKRVRLRIETRILREGDPDALCTGHVWLAAVTREGRPVPLPEDLRAALLGRGSGKTGSAPVV